MLDFTTLSTEQQITAIFVGFFDRAPAPGGLRAWAADVDSGNFTLAEVARAFTVQPETQALFPGLATAGADDLATNLALVTAIFQNVFDRAPNNITENGGADNFWVNELQNGADVGELILNIMSGAQGSDLELLTNKIEVGLNYALASEAAGITARQDAGDTILDDVTAADTSVAAAQESIDSTFSTPTTPTPGDANQISLNPDAAVIPGTDGADIFSAESGDLTSAVQLNGGAGTDALTVFNETTGTVAISPRTESIEQVYVTNQANDLNSVADNNVGGYSNDGTNGTVEVDVEIDAGRMEDVTRLENYDSRADLVIEDVRDGNPDDGTFTAAMTVAMVSTDPGNVDYAVYFDDPINTSTDSGTLTVQILDLDSSAAGNGPLANNPYDEVSFNIDGTLVRLTVADLDAANASYAAYIAALQASANAQDIPVTISAGSQFTLIQANGSAEVGTEINITVEDAQITEGGFNANDGLPANNNTVTRQTPLNQTAEAKITLNVEFDDVGKGSTGGDAMFGAMSTGRQTGDDATSDSVGIERFEITVDRGSILQTINSTNNSLEEVQIANGENTGLNNTTNAADNAAGHLTVRGNANPSVTEQTTTAGVLNGPSGVATDGAMPGAAPQHNAFGFTDVRTIEAGGMNGALDITAELTEEIVEKYLDIQDTQPTVTNGEADDVDFIYTLGNGNDEFLLNMSSDALVAAGTGSREDFDMSISGGAGADVITTNIGGNQEPMTPGNALSTAGALKKIDEQGQDYYELTSDNVEFWYENSISNIAAEFEIDGGAGNDVIWTHGWGDVTISDGAGNDAVYTDNSGATELSAGLMPNIDRVLTEHEQIDYVYGSVWAFNAEGALPAGGSNGSLTGISNGSIALATLAANDPLLTATSGSLNVVLSYDGGQGTNTNDYNVTVAIPFSEININQTTRVVSITEQTLNQAIKAGVNNDSGVLSNVLEAYDGPGNSLIVASKVDGVHDADDFTVSFAGTMTLGSTTTVAVTPLAVAQYTTPTFASGVDSTAESDNTINVGSGNDVFVLSTNDGGAAGTSNLNGASNEVLNMSDGFGLDTVFNFSAGANDGVVDFADDVFDFTGITGVTTNTLLGAVGDSTVNTTNATAAGSVDIVLAANIADANASGTLDAADFLAIYQGDAVASNHIIIVYDRSGDNGGEVWEITDGAAATGDVQATDQGTINLIGTDWTTIANDNIA